MSTNIILSGNGELSSQRVPEISQQVEERGFDGLWFGETTLRDASILAAFAASATKRIELGTSILNVFTRTPSQLALLAATLNEFSAGRFTLGLGVSTAAIVENWHGQPFQRPNYRLDETVKLLRLYFSGEKVIYNGEFSAPKGARMKSAFPPKIALAALNDGMLEKAAKVADRIILNMHPPERIERDLSIINEACRKAGGKARPNLSVMLYSYVLGDNEKGIDAENELVAFYASAPAYSTLFTSLGYGSEAKAMMDGWKAKDRGAVKKVVTPEMVKRLTVLGTIQDLRDRVREYHKSGVDDVFIAPSPFGDYEANIHEITEHYF